MVGQLDPTQFVSVACTSSKECEPYDGVVFVTLLTFYLRALSFFLLLLLLWVSKLPIVILRLNLFSISSCKVQGLFLLYTCSVGCKNLMAATQMPILVYVSVTSCTKLREESSKWITDDYNRLPLTCSGICVWMPVFKNGCWYACRCLNIG